MEREIHGVEEKAVTTDIVNALLSRDGKILLARRSRHRRSYPGTWSFPGGHVEPGEQLEAALERELVEEIGVTPTAFSTIARFDDPNVRSTRAVRYHLFQVVEWAGGEPAIVNHEHSALAWLSPREALEYKDLALDVYRQIFRGLADEFDLKRR